MKVQKLLISDGENPDTTLTLNCRFVHTPTPRPLNETIYN